MAEGSIENPLVPEKTEPKRGQRVRRNSTGKLEIANIGIIIPSRYLRASIGSCHDWCKYAKKDAIEVKASSFSKMVTAKGGESQVLEKVVTSAERMKKSAISPKTSADSKTQKPNNPVENASYQKLKPVLSKPSSHPAQGCLSSPRNSQVIKSKESPGGSGRTSKCKNGSKELTTITMGEKNAVSPTNYLSAKQRISMITRNLKNLKGVSHLKNEIYVKKVKPKQPSGEDVLEKTLYIVEASTENKTAEPSQNGLQTTDLSSSSSPPLKDKSLKYARKGKRTTRVPPSSEKKNLSRTGTGFHATRSPPSSSLSLGNKGLRHTQYGTRSAKSSLSSYPPESPRSKEHVADKTETEYQMANAKLECRSRPGRGGIIGSENKGSLARKLKFRRGKMVDIHSENSAPRRLKFKRARLIGEIQNCKDKTRKFTIRSKEAEDGELSGTTLKSEKVFQRGRRFNKRKAIGDSENGSENGTKIKSEKVVLRHQNVEEKKDSQSLYNNVIEETASKLVVSRKSKVKALVGAFETVISLQDDSASVTTVT